MQIHNLSEKKRRRLEGLVGIAVLSLGIFISIRHGMYLYSIENAWSSNDPNWKIFFFGLLFCFFGLTHIWNWLFARDLTGSEIQQRDQWEDFQYERHRKFANDRGAVIRSSEDDAGQ